MSAAASEGIVATLKRTLGSAVVGGDFQLFAELDIEVREQTAKIELLFLTSLPNSVSPRTKERISQPAESPRTIIKGQSVELIPKNSPICSDLCSPQTYFPGMSESEKDTYLKECEGTFQFPKVKNLTFKTRNEDGIPEDKKKNLSIFVHWIVKNLFPNVPQDQIDRTMR